MGKLQEGLSVLSTVARVECARAGSTSDASVQPRQQVSCCPAAVLCRCAMRRDGWQSVCVKCTCNRTHVRACVRCRLALTTRQCEVVRSCRWTRQCRHRLMHTRSTASRRPARRPSAGPCRPRARPHHCLRLARLCMRRRRRQTGTLCSTYSLSVRAARKLSRGVRPNGLFWLRQDSITQRAIMWSSSTHRWTSNM